MCAPYPQLKGTRLTKKCYRVATIFINHFSCLHFVCLQLDTSSEETMATKIVFEKFDAEHGVKILHYHCDNWHSFDSTLSKACHDARQKLIFLGVNMHFKTALLREPYATSWRAHASNCSMLALAGLRQCILPCGHMNCAIPCTSTIVYQCWRRAH
jgi:hypothetical protein